LSLILAQY